jgi:transposase
MVNDAAILDLPDDPILLKRMIAERNALIGEHEAALIGRQMQIEQMRRQSDAAIEQIKREAAETIEAMQQRHKAELDAVLRRFYGPHSERFDPTQLLLFGLKVAEQMPVDEKAIEAEAGEKLKTRRINHHKHGRRELPAHLPRIEIPHDLTDEQKKCPCCTKDRLCIGCEISEQLEFVSASFKVLKHVRYKYACKPCGEGCEHCDGSPHIEIATKAAQPIEKGLPGPGLLAHVIVSKLGDHLPLYRLEKIYARNGVDIARSTMCAWMLSCGDLVKPLVDLMIKRVKQSRAIHTDETRVPVQDETVKGKCKSGRIWCFLGDESNPYDVYQYTPDRTRAGPQKFLDDFKGYLQADAYGGYDGIYTRGNVIEVACWAHGRRKFFDARETDGRRAAEMLAMVGELYAVEDEAKEAIAEMLKETSEVPRAEQERIRLELRQEKSVPVLARIKSWLDTEEKLVLPRSPMAAAIGYLLNQWVALCVYATTGLLNIDNNAAERAMKRVAIGRKNWLFAGNDTAGQSHARLWTLIASAERHGLDPQKYMMSVLAKISQTPLSELEQFLPDKWKADDAAEPAARNT